MWQGAIRRRTSDAARDATSNATHDVSNDEKSGVIHDVQVVVTQVVDALKENDDEEHERLQTKVALCEPESSELAAQEERTDELVSDTVGQGVSADRRAQIAAQDLLRLRAPWIGKPGAGGGQHVRVERD